MEKNLVAEFEAANAAYVEKVEANVRAIKWQQEANRRAEATYRALVTAREKVRNLERTVRMVDEAPIVPIRMDAPVIRPEEIKIDMPRKNWWKTITKPLRVVTP